jgi:hypothetical protein
MSDNQDSFGPAVLSFDEMALSKIIQFDIKEQEALGPFSDVQIAMAWALRRLESTSIL